MRSYDLTRSLPLCSYRAPQVELPRGRWSTFQLKRLVFFSNFFWFLITCGTCYVIGWMFLQQIRVESARLAERQQAFELQQQINRLAQMTSLSAAQTLELAQTIQKTLDTASGQQRAFLSAIVPLAIRLQTAYRIPASATVGMAIYESRYGTSVLAQEHNNFFGIKALDPSWSGEKTYQPTRDSGVATHAYFRKYPSMESGIEGYAQFLRNSERYQGAFGARRGIDFIQSVLKAGYCPDGDYAGNVSNIIERHRLAELDKVQDMIAQPAQQAPAQAVAPASASPKLSLVTPAEAAQAILAKAGLSN